MVRPTWQLGAEPSWIAASAPPVWRSVSVAVPCRTLLTSAGLSGDNYFCRSATITLAGWCRPDGPCEATAVEGADGLGWAGQVAEAEAYGRQDAGSGGRGGRHECAHGTHVGDGAVAVGDHAGAGLAHAARALRRGLGARHRPAP